MSRILKRLARVPILGRVLRMGLNLAKNPALSPQHLNSKNRAHNRKQAAILRDFERQTHQKLGGKI